MRTQFRALALAVVTVIGLLTAGCTSPPPGPTSTPTDVPGDALAIEVHDIYQSVHASITGVDPAELPLYEGDFSDVGAFCLVSDDGFGCTRSATDIAAISSALELSDIEGQSMMLFIGVPLYLETPDGMLWGVRQPSDGSAGTPRKELLAAIRSARWGEAP